MVGTRTERIGLVCGVVLAGGAALGQGFVDATARLGLDATGASRVRFADVNNDGFADIVYQPPAKRRFPEAPVVMLHSGGGSAGGTGVRFAAFDGHGLPALEPNDMVVFADLDDDGLTDAIVTRYLTSEADSDARPGADQTGWCKGLGEGRFGPLVPMPYASQGTVSAIAVGDVNADGLLDVCQGNWYTAYGQSLKALRNDRLVQVVDGAGNRNWLGSPCEPAAASLIEETDLGGRPTYGIMLAHLDDASTHAPEILELNYGRRWNRLWAVASGGERAPGQTLAREDIGPRSGFDGDDIRHGAHPDWLKERAKTDPRFDRDDELPYRANGNTFDAAVGDIDNDGDFDVFLAEITHAWAGESSDRSRFLVNRLAETGALRFESPETLSVDRIPTGSTDPEVIQRWNQGDLFCELADLNNDGRLDLILASGDYPDPPPYDERLRIYLQNERGLFDDATAALGIDHLGCGQVSLADIDHDGDLDILAAQSFTRFGQARALEAGVANGSLTLDWPATPDLEPDDPRRAGPPLMEGSARPRLRIFENRCAGANRSLVVKLVGDPGATPPVARDALGAIVLVTADTDGDPATAPLTMSRQLIGVGGHAGKQHEFIVHVGLGKAGVADRVEIVWPTIGSGTTVLEGVEAGRHEVRYAADR